MRAAVVILLATACGASPSPAPPTPQGPAASFVAMPAAADDVVVARVNDKPVYAYCVQTQARRGASKAEALQQCIDFELLAQIARDRDLETDGEVTLATRTALVSQLVAREYEDKYTKPADFGAFWDQSIARNKQRIEHGEARASAYLRITLPKDASPEQVESARLLAEELARELGKERGMLVPHFKEIGERVIAGRAKLDHQVVPAYLHNGGLDPGYENPLFEIPEVGRTSPVTRTRWGWDVILLTELYPAEKMSPEKVIETYLPDIKRSYFTQWANQIAQALGVTVKRFEENIPKLEEL